MFVTSLLAKSLAAKIALGFVGASVAGTAVAAETGALPAPVQQVAYQVAGTVGVPAPQQPETSPTAVPSPLVSSPAGPRPSRSPEAHESESPHAEDASEGPEASSKPDCHSGKTDCVDHGRDDAEHAASVEAHKSAKPSAKPSRTRSPRPQRSESGSHGGSGKND
jgi:hypothetical protein